MLYSGAKNMCNECNQTFPTKRGLANHRRVHKWRENPKKSVDTWEPPEENGCGKVDKDGDGILSTTAKTGNEYGLYFIFYYLYININKSPVSVIVKIVMPGKKAQPDYFLTFCLYMAFFFSG